jgi:hypothetical protein
VSLHVNRRVAESTAKGERKDTHRAPAKRTSPRYASRPAHGNARIMLRLPCATAQGMHQTQMHTPTSFPTPIGNPNESTVGLDSQSSWE